MSTQGVKSPWAIAIRSACTAPATGCIRRRWRGDSELSGSRSGTLETFPRLSGTPQPPASRQWWTWLSTGTPHPTTGAPTPAALGRRRPQLILVVPPSDCSPYPFDIMAIYALYQTVD